MTSTQRLAKSPKTFRDRDQWMRAVLASDLPLAVRLVAVRIALHLRVETGQCDPGYDVLAAELHMSKRSIIRMVAMLEHTGWIEVARGGHHRPNQFFLLSGDRGDKSLSPLRGDTTLSPQNPSEVTNSNVRGDRIGESEVTHAVTHKAKRKAKRKAEESDSPPADFFDEAKKDSLGEESSRKKDQAETFAKLWAVYPRHDAEEPARRAFAKAIEDTDPEVIIAGAQHYAAAEQARLARPGQIPQHTAMLANWLRDRRWNDPKGTPVIDQSGNPVAVQEAEDTETFLDMEAIEADFERSRKLLARLGLGPNPGRH